MFLTLTAADAGKTIPLATGLTYVVTGDDSANTFEIAAGAITTISGGGGTDVIKFLGSSSDYTVALSGTNAVFTRTADGSVVTIPVQTTAGGNADTVQFGTGAPVVLSSTGSTVSLGAQTIAATSSDVTGATGTAAATTVTPTPTGSFTLTTSATSVTEGTPVVFTLKADVAPTVDTTLTYLIEGTTSGVATAATPASDLGKATGSVTIKANATTATFSLTPSNDGIIEGFEAFKVSVLDSNFKALSVSNVVVITDGLSSGTNFTLTSGADGGASFTGSDGDDRFSGVIIDVNGTGTTYNPGDNIVGGAGTDTLSLSISGNNNNGAATLTISGETISGVERFNVSNYDSNTNQANTHTIDLSGVTGLTTVALTGSTDNGDTLFTGSNSLVAAELSNGGGDLSVAYSSAVTLTGTSDTQTVTVNGVTSAATFTSTTNGFEVFNIVATGTKSTLTAIALGSPTSGTQTVNISGSVDLAITNALANTVKKVDASTFIGNLTIGLPTGVDTSVTGGTGNDTFEYTSALDNADTVDGGAGTADVIAITTSLSSTLSNVKNIEILRVGGNAQSFDVTKITGLTGYQIKGGTPTSPALNNLANNATVTLLETNTTGATLAQSSADSTLNVAVDNSIAKALTGVDGVAVTLTNVKTLNLSSVGGNLNTTASAVNSNSFDLGTTSALTTINVTGDTDLSLDNDASIDATIGAINSTVTKVDATNFTGRMYVTASTTATSINGGSAADSITGGSGNDTLFGGAGNDTIASGGGDDNITGNDGIDSISLGAASASTKVVTVDGGAGNDTLTLTSATGYFNLAGGVGDDSFVVSGATFIYFDSNDTLAGGDGTDTLTFAATNGASFDLAANASYLGSTSGFEAVKLDVSGLTSNNDTLAFTFNDVLASNIGNGTLSLTVADATTPAANTGADVTVDASGVLLNSTKVNLTGSASVQYVYSVGGATENVALNVNADRLNVTNIGYIGAADTLNGGDGSDTLTLAYGATSSTAVTFDTAKMTAVSGFETLNFDGVTGIGTGAITATITDAFAIANKAAASNTLTIVRSQFGATTIDDTGTTKVTASAVTNSKLDISGGSGADTILSGTQDDTIAGGKGFDSITGGLGKDTFYFDGVAGEFATVSTDTITDIDFGTSTTAVDNIKVDGTWSAAGLYKASVGGGSGDYRVIVLDTASYTDLSFAEDAAAAVKTANATDYLFLWQDGLGTVHLSFDGAQNTDSSGTESASATVGLLDLAKFTGVTITGVASNIDIADFTFA